MTATGSDRYLPTIQPLTARSVVLSTLLGYNPPALPSRALVKVGSLFDVAEPTIRVALTRMTSDGDLIARDGTYHLSERLIRRQEQQEEVRAPKTVPWDGTWEQAVVDDPARSAAGRSARRKLMLTLRLGELREGVWLRPANLSRRLDVVAEHCTLFRCHHADPEALARTLWDLEAWAADARGLLGRLVTVSNLRDDFIAVAEALRHLQVDPFLPDELLPRDWPGAELRGCYTEFRKEYAARLRDYSTDP